MIVEPCDDSEFIGWIEANPTGFVLNCHRRPKSSYLKLHRGSCTTLRGQENYAGGDYRKVCSTSQRAIEQWAIDVVGGPVQLCGTCNPEGT